MGFPIKLFDKTPLLGTEPSWSTDRAASLNPTSLDNSYYLRVLAPWRHHGWMVVGTRGPCWGRRFFGRPNWCLPSDVTFFFKVRDARLMQ
jgi:hypothetical protein